MSALVLQGVIECLHWLNRLSSYACIGFIESGSKSALVLELLNACNDDRNCRCMNTSIGFIEWVIECMHVLLSLHAIESRSPLIYIKSSNACIDSSIKWYSSIRSFYECFMKFVFFCRQGQLVNCNITNSMCICDKVLPNLNKNKKNIRHVLAW